MAQFILFDEVRLRVFVPRGLPDTEADATSRALDSVRFRVRLLRAVRRVFRRFRSLRRARVRLKR
jgi:hypothetical protein